MAQYKVSELKTLIAGIPAKFNNMDVDIVEGTTIPIVSDRATGPSGERYFKVRAYVFLDTKVFEEIQ